MKFRDAVKLGHLNIRQQKRRSLMMAVVIGAVLCLLLVVNLMMAGVRRNVEKFGQTDGRRKNISDDNSEGGSVWG